MDYKTHDAGSRSIATGCVHVPSGTTNAENAFIAETVTEGVQGICTFYEFVKHIGGVPFDGYRKYGWGWHLEPSVPDHVAEVAILGATDGHLAYTPNRIHHTLVGQAPQATIYQTVSDVAQDAREIAVGRGWNIITTAVDQSKQYLRVLACYRIQDQWTHLEPYVRTHQAAQPFLNLLETRVIPFNDVFDNPLSSFTRFSYQAALQGTTGVTQAQRNAFRLLIRTYGTEGGSGDGRSRGHQRILDAAKQARTELSTDIQGCATS